MATKKYATVQDVARVEALAQEARDLAKETRDVAWWIWNTIQPAPDSTPQTPPIDPDPQPANPPPVSSDYPPDVQNAIEAAKHIVATGGTLANWVDDAINNQGTLGQHEYEVRMEAANAVVGYGVWWEHLTRRGLLDGTENPKP